MAGKTPKYAESGERPPDPQALFAPLGAVAGGGDREPLLDLLRQSARETAGWLEILEKDARRIGAALVDRRATDAFQLAQGIRVFIACLWAAAAVFLVFPHLAFRLAAKPLPAFALPEPDAFALGSIFSVLFFLGAVGAYLPLFLAAMNDRFSSRAIVERSQNYGRRLAEILKRLDARLLHHRDALTAPGASDAEVAAEVARAHVTASAAIALFEELGFLIDDEDPRAQSAAVETYRRYLHATAGYSENDLARKYVDGLIGGAIAGLLFGAVFGIAFALEAFGVVLGKSLGDLFGAMSGIEKYPHALGAILFGALTYFFLAEPLGEVLDDAAGRSQRRLRTDESLRAVRSAITGAEAPRARDIAQRVEDLSAIFRTRLARAPAGGAAHADDEPAWRRPPEAPRFVAPAFAAAPPLFRADSQGRREKIFPKKEAQDAAPKQGFDFRDAPPWFNP